MGPHTTRWRGRKRYWIANCCCIQGRRLFNSLFLSLSLFFFCHMHLHNTIWNSIGWTLNFLSHCSIQHQGLLSPVACRYVKCYYSTWHTTNIHTHTHISRHSHKMQNIQLLSCWHFGSTQTNVKKMNNNNNTGMRCGALCCSSNIKMCVGCELMTISVDAQQPWCMRTRIYRGLWCDISWSILWHGFISHTHTHIFAYESLCTQGRL